MQLTQNELTKAVESNNKQVTFMKGNNKALVLDIPNGDLKFTLDLTRLSPFLLEYLTYYAKEEDRVENLHYNFDRYGFMEFIADIYDTVISSTITYLKTQNAEFDAWASIDANASKLIAGENLAFIDFTLEGMPDNAKYASVEEQDFYLIRDTASKVSGIDLSGIDPTLN